MSESRGRRRLVLHVITRMILGGAQENTLLSVVGTDASPGWRSELVTGPALGPEGALLSLGRVSSVVVHEVPSLRREIAPLQDAIALLQLFWLFARLRPTVVHTHSSKAGILGRLAARLAGVPVVVHTIHGLPFHEFQTARERRLYVLAERLAAPLADRIYGVATAMCRKALAARVGRPGQLEVVRSGMETRAFLSAGEDEVLRARTRGELGFDPGDRVVTLVGRLFELKGHDDLLTVAARLAPRWQDLRLLLVGDGIRRAELEARAAALGLRATFTGLVEPGRIPALLAASDLLVHTSLREGLARVLPQALLVGLPVISYDIDGACEVVRRDVSGWLVTPGDLDELERACESALVDPARARAMAATGRAICREEFDADRMVARLLRDYSKLLARSHSR